MSESINIAKWEFSIIYLLANYKSAETDKKLINIRRKFKIIKWNSNNDGWLTRIEIFKLSKKLSQNLFVELNSNSLAIKINPLVKAGLILKNENIWTKGIRDERSIFTHKLNPYKYEDIALIFFKYGKFNEFFDSDYNKLFETTNAGNMVRRDSHMQFAMAISNVKDAYYSSEQFKLHQSQMLPNIYNLYFEYLKDKKTFGQKYAHLTRTIKKVLKEIEATPNNYFDLIVSSLLISDIANRTFNNEEYPLEYEKSLKTNLHSMFQREHSNQYIKQQIKTKQTGGKGK